VIAVPTDAPAPASSGLGGLLTSGDPVLGLLVGVVPAGLALGAIILVFLRYSRSRR
jgi:hypothetical protein